MLRFCLAIHNTYKYYDLLRESAPRAACHGRGKRVATVGYMQLHCSGVLTHPSTPKFIASPVTNTLDRKGLEGTPDWLRRMRQGVDDDGVAAMGYMQLHGGRVSPAAALQAVQEMRGEGDGGASLQACPWLPNLAKL